MPVSKKQFKAYFVALLADKEYAKVLEAVAKVDKSFKSSVPGPASGSSAASAQTSKALLLRLWFAWPPRFHVFQTVL